MQTEHTGSILSTFKPRVLRRGHWDFRFYAFGQFLVWFFGFCSQKLRFSGFGISCGFWIFSSLAFGFWFLSTVMVFFWILLPNSFYGFSGFAKKVTPHSRTKTVIPGNHLQLKECMTSLVSLAALTWVATAAKQPAGGMRINFCWV